MTDEGLKDVSDFLSLNMHTVLFFSSFSFEDVTSMHWTFNSLPVVKVEDTGIKEKQREEDVWTVSLQQLCLI